jgi:hypothetical protein
MKQFLYNLINAMKPSLEALIVGAAGVAVDTAIALADGSKPLTWRTAGAALLAALADYLTSYLRREKVKIVQSALNGITQGGPTNG